MIRIIIISILISLGLVSCGSLKYSSYNRPFDFIHLHHNSIHSHKGSTELDSTSITNQPTNKQAELNVDPFPKKEIIPTKLNEVVSQDSLVKAKHVTPNQHFTDIPTKRNHLHLKKGNISTLAHKVQQQKITKRNNNWEGFLLILLISIAILLVLAIIFAYLSSSPTGRLIFRNNNFGFINRRNYRRSCL